MFELGASGGFWAEKGVMGVVFWVDMERGRMGSVFGIG